MIVKEKMPRVVFCLLLAFWTLAAPVAVGAEAARHGMVVAQEARAAQVGVDILKKGGNAVDAAVATGFALAVTYPRAGNIGGGGYMVIHLARRNSTSPSTTARPRRPRPRATSSSTSAARPIRGSRATPRSRSACRARWLGWRSRTSAMALAASRWPN